MITPFHLAIAVDDLDAARRFYGGVLGCSEGRSSTSWVDFNLYGHQLVCHEIPKRETFAANPVDGDLVPIPHFGVVLAWEDWEALGKRLEVSAIEFEISPRVRFEGQSGEQATMFFRDPAGNAIEFKAFRDFDQLFAR
ncbi:MAG: VOC family protein [Pseudomonadota bacterium]